VKKPLAMLALTAIGTFGSAACTPQEARQWRQWHRQEPADAEAFVRDGCAEQCDDTREGDIFDVPGDPWGQCAEWMSDALAAGWTEEQWGTLNWIMAAESGCEPGATSSAGAIGLLQIMPFWADECGGGGLHVLHEQGWTAWDVYG
jgi:hypothetical protein